MWTFGDLRNVCTECHMKQTVSNSMIDSELYWSTKPSTLYNKYSIVWIKLLSLVDILPILLVKAFFFLKNGGNWSGNLQF